MFGGHAKRYPAWIIQAICWRWLPTLSDRFRLSETHKKGTRLGAFEPMEHLMAHKKLERLMPTFSLCYLLT